MLVPASLWTMALPLGVHGLWSTLPHYHTWHDALRFSQCNREERDLRIQLKVHNQNLEDNLRSLGKRFELSKIRCDQVKSASTSTKKAEEDVSQIQRDRTLIAQQLADEHTRCTVLQKDLGISNNNLNEAQKELKLALGNILDLDAQWTAKMHDIRSAHMQEMHDLEHGMLRAKQQELELVNSRNSATMQCLELEHRSECEKNIAQLQEAADKKLFDAEQSFSCKLSDAEAKSNSALARKQAEIMEVHRGWDLELNRVLDSLAASKARREGEVHDTEHYWKSQLEKELALQHTKLESSFRESISLQDKQWQIEVDDLKSEQQKRLDQQATEIEERCRQNMDASNQAQSSVISKLRQELIDLETFRSVVFLQQGTQTDCGPGMEAVQDNFDSGRHFTDCNCLAAVCLNCEDYLKQRDTQNSLMFMHLMKMTQEAKDIAERAKQLKVDIKGQKEDAPNSAQDGNGSSDDKNGVDNATEVPYLALPLVQKYLPSPVTVVHKARGVPGVQKRDMKRHSPPQLDDRTPLAVPRETVDFDFEKSMGTDHLHSTRATAADNNRGHKLRVWNL
eukprot:gene170-362_t